jgi:hypothetical protein
MSGSPGVILKHPSADCDDAGNQQEKYRQTEYIQKFNTLPQTFNIFV